MKSTIPSTPSGTDRSRHGIVPVPPPECVAALGCGPFVGPFDPVGRAEEGKSAATAETVEAGADIEDEWGLGERLAGQAPAKEAIQIGENFSDGLIEVRRDLLADF